MDCSPIIQEFSCQYVNQELPLLTRLTESKRSKHLFVIKSPTGTGKTTYLKQLIKKIKGSLIMITYRKSLANYLSRELGVSNYLSFSTHRSIPFNENTKIIVSIESLRKIKDKDNAIPIPDWLIIDEAGGSYEHYSSETIGFDARGLYSKFLEACGMSQEGEAKKVCSILICDAYYGKFDLDMSTIFMPTRSIMVFKNTYRNYDCEILHVPTLQCFSELFLKEATAEDYSKRILFCSNSKTKIRAFEQLYQFHTGLKDSSTVVINNAGDTRTTTTAYPEKIDGDNRFIIHSDSQEEDKLLYSEDPVSSWTRHRILYITPTINAGIDFNPEEVYFDTCFAFAGHNSSSARSVLQHIARSRRYLSKRIYVFLPPALKYPISDRVDYIKSCIKNNASYLKDNTVKLLPKSIVISLKDMNLQYALDYNDTVTKALIRIIQYKISNHNDFSGMFKSYIPSSNYKFSEYHPETELSAEDFKRMNSLIGRSIIDKGVSIALRSILASEDSVHAAYTSNLGKYSKGVVPAWDKLMFFFSEYMVNGWLLSPAYVAITPMTILGADPDEESVSMFERDNLVKFLKEVIIDPAIQRKFDFFIFGHYKDIVKNEKYSEEMLTEHKLAMDYWSAPSTDVRFYQLVLKFLNIISDIQLVPHPIDENLQIINMTHFTKTHNPYFTISTEVIYLDYDELSEIMNEISECYPYFKLKKFDVINQKAVNYMRQKVAELLSVLGFSKIRMINPEKKNYYIDGVKLVLRVATMRFKYKERLWLSTGRLLFNKFKKGRPINEYIVLGHFHHDPFGIIKTTYSDPFNLYNKSYILKLFSTSESDTLKVSEFVKTMYDKFGLSEREKLTPDNIHLLFENDFWKEQ